MRRSLSILVAGAVAGVVLVGCMPTPDAGPTSNRAAHVATPRFAPPTTTGSVPVSTSPGGPTTANTAQPTTRLVAAPARSADGPWQESTADLQMLSDTRGWALGFGCGGCQIPIDMTTDGGATWRRVPSPVGAVDSGFGLRVRAGAAVGAGHRRATMAVPPPRRQPAR